MKMIICHLFIIVIDLFHDYFTYFFDLSIITTYTIFVIHLVLSFRITLKTARILIIFMNHYDNKESNFLIIDMYIVYLN